MNLKKILSLLIFIIFCVPSFSQDWKQSVFSQLSVAKTRSVNADSAAVEYFYNIENQKFHGSAGIQIAEKQYAFYLCPSYNFYSNNGKSFGAVLDLEFEKYDDISYRSNSFFGFTWDVFFESSRIGVYGNIMGGRKSSRLIGFEDLDPLVTWNPAVNATVYYLATEALTLSFSLNSSEPFYRPEFFAPIISTSARFRITDKFFVSGYVGIRGIDLCILSSYVDSFVFKIGLGVDL